MSIPSEKYDLAIKLNDHITKEQLALIVCLFKDHDFNIFSFHTRNSYILFLKFDKVSQILKEAERLRLQKEKKSEELQKTMKSTKNFMKNALNRNMFKSLDLVSPKILKYENYETVTPSTIHKFVNNCCEKIEDLDSILASTKANIINLFSSSELLRIKYSIVNKLRLFDLNIIDFLHKQKLMIGIYPLYEDDKTVVNMRSMERLFGEKVYLYFEFMKFYIHWITFPAIIGILNYAFKLIFKKAFHQLLINYSYSLLVTIWFTIFLIYWQRKQNEINIKCGSYGKIFLVADKNPNFKAPEKINLITGLPMEHYSKYKRVFFYIISILEAIPFLLLGSCLKIVILTLKGIIVPGEYFYFEKIGELINDGGVLCEIKHLRLILDFMQIEMTNKINMLYKLVCQNSTERENHRTNQAAENSYALKRFCFEFLNRFLYLGYIAYVKVDFSCLIHELLIIFTLDEIRRVVLESLIPLIFKKFSQKRLEKQILSVAKKDQMNPYIAEKIIELNLPDYDNFDDYLEIIIQFCYLILFAGVFPQASYLSLFFNLIEVYSDSFKLTHKLYKRPIPMKSNGIGCWMWLLNILSFICVFSNTFLFAFSYYNYYYALQVEKTKDSEDELESTKCIWENILFDILITEHLILSIILLIRYLIKSQPKWVRIFLKRQEKKNNSTQKE